MTTDPLAYIARKFSLDLTPRSPWRPIEIACKRHGPLLQLWRELGYTRVAEIGVERGLFSAEICKHMPDATLYSIDPWVAYTRYKDEVSQEKIEGFFQETLQRLAPFGKRSVIIREDSLEAAKGFAPGSLDAVFIDGNHEYRYVVDDIDTWARIVRPGGMVCGHDYRGLDRLQDDGSRRLPFHVPPAVNGFVDSWELQPLFVFRGDKAPSWGFIRPPYSWRGW